jgi:hypothetical protein
MPIPTTDRTGTPTPMTFLTTLADALRAAHPDWQVALDPDGRRLVLDAGQEPAVNTTPRFVLGEDDGVVFLEGLWRLPVTEESEEGIRELLLEVLGDGMENRGWEVPILLYGGPLSGRRITKPWDDLVGRLLFATQAGHAGHEPRAYLYKWHLRRNDEGDYVCHYERTLRGDEVDDFLRRGVAETGPYVISHV